MELENVNPNGNNVVVKNLINISFLTFENCKNWVQKWRSYVVFPTRCQDCPKNKILHNSGSQTFDEDWWTMLIESSTEWTLNQSDEFKVINNLSTSKSKT
jgi:hypothetical protein